MVMRLPTRLTWYADDGTLITNNIEDMTVLLDIVDKFSNWSGIRLNVGKYKIPAYIQSLQPIHKKTRRDDALWACLAHVSIGGQRIGFSLKTNPSQGDISAQPLQPHFVQTTISDGLSIKSS
jgi:hypothetical protein